jgi:hypothetical protein
MRLKNQRIFAWRAEPALGLVGVLCTLCLGLLCGCSRTSEPGREKVVIFGLDDQVSGAPQGVRFDLKRARKMLSEALEGSQKLGLVSEDAPGVFRAELIIALASERESTRAEENGIYRAVQVDLTLSRWVDDESQKLYSQGQAFLVQDPDKVDRKEGFDRVLQQAVGRAVEMIDLQLESRHLPAERLTELLNSQNNEDRLYVLRALRERRVPEMMPRIIEMLSDPDPDVAMEAVGVLVAQKEQRAAVPLIRMAQGRDRVFLFQIITALAEIQGPVAKGFLFTLAAGHDSPEVRKRAREALGQIERREEVDRPGKDKAVAFPRTQSEKTAPRGGP